MKKSTKNPAHKIAATYAAHKGSWISDFPAISSVVIASIIGLVVIGVFTQVSGGNLPDAWVLYR